MPGNKVKRMSGAIKPNVYKTADTKNKENFPAWTMNTQERVKQLLHTGTLEASFYADRKEIAAGAVEAFEAAPEDFLFKWIPIGRNKGFMRTSPILALEILFERSPARAQAIFDQVILTGNDLADFIDIRIARGKGFGRGVKTAMKKWIGKHLNEFYAIKYGNDITRAVRLARPSQKDVGNYVFSVIQYLMKDVENKYKNKGYVIPENLIKLRAFEDLKKVDPADLPKIKELIKLGRLDYSVVTMVNKSPELWKTLMKEMGVFALIRHLVTFERNGLESDNEVVNYLFGPEGRISADNMLKAKVLPFRAYQAYQMVNSTTFKNALAEMMDQFLPKYDFKGWGKVAVCPDTSGSMTGTLGRTNTFAYRAKPGYRDNQSTMTYSDIASLFGAVLYKGIRGSELFPWDDTVYTAPPRSDSVASITQYIKTGRGGGTFMELPLKLAMYGEVGAYRDTYGFGYRPHDSSTRKISRANFKPMEFDTWVFITDTTEWGEGWLKYWKEYKKLFPKSKAFMIRIDPYPTQPFSDEDAKKLGIYQIAGWSNAVIDWIQYILNPPTEADSVEKTEEVEVEESS